jgi:hypothetical protein
VAKPRREMLPPADHGIVILTRLARGVFFEE